MSSITSMCPLTIRFLLLNWLGYFLILQNDDGGSPKPWWRLTSRDSIYAPPIPLRTGSQLGINCTSLDSGKSLTKSNSQRSSSQNDSLLAVRDCHGWLFVLSIINKTSTRPYSLNIKQPLLAEAPFCLQQCRCLVISLSRRVADVMGSLMLYAVNRRL